MIYNNWLKIPQANWPIASLIFASKRWKLSYFRHFGVPQCDERVSFLPDQWPPPEQTGVPVESERRIEQGFTLGWADFARVARGGKPENLFLPRRCCRTRKFSSCVSRAWQTTRPISLHPTLSRWRIVRREPGTCTVDAICLGKKLTTGKLSNDPQST